MEKRGDVSIQIRMEQAEKYKDDAHLRSVRGCTPNRVWGGDGLQLPGIDGSW
jgi:hypothetical protein